MFYARKSLPSFHHHLRLREKGWQDIPGNSPDPRIFSNVPTDRPKISPHIHDSLGNARLFATLTGMRIFEDLAPHHKNSGQFLEAGALRSFFLETDDEHLPLGFDMFLKEGNPHNYPVICESGALGNLVKPGLLVFIGRSTGDLPLHKATTLHQADLVLPAKTFSTSEVIDRISFRDHGWHYIA